MNNRWRKYLSGTNLLIPFFAVLNFFGFYGALLLGAPCLAGCLLGLALIITIDTLYNHTVP